MTDGCYPSEQDIQRRFKEECAAIIDDLGASLPLEAVAEENAGELAMQLVTAYSYGAELELGRVMRQIMDAHVYFLAKRNIDHWLEDHATTATYQTAGRCYERT